MVFNIPSKVISIVKYIRSASNASFISPFVIFSTANPFKKPVNISAIPDKNNIILAIIRFLYLFLTSILLEALFVLNLS